jgi:hypothetical protein
MKLMYPSSGFCTSLDPITAAFFWRSKTDRLLKVELEEVIESTESAGCTGYDEDENALMVPMKGNNKIKVKIGGASQGLLQQIQFVSYPAGKLTISPKTPTSADQELTLSGTAAALDVKIQMEINGTKIDLFEVDVLKKLIKTLEIHAIIEQNDDVQKLTVGANVGKNEVCVEAGPNGFRDTNPQGDDQVVGNNITSGADGICDTTANDQNLSPSNLPTATQVEDFLNTKAWGNQANVHFTVTRTDHVVNYDLDRNMSLGDPVGYQTIPALPNELKAINNSLARNAGVDYNYYVTDRVDVPIAITQYSPDIVMSEDSSTAPFLIIMAHECGHLLKGAGGHTDEKDTYLMHTNIDGLGGCQVQRKFWRIVNK